MMHRLFLPLTLCSCLTLSACGDNAPHKNDVEHTLKEQAINQAFQFQGLLRALLGDDDALARKKQEIATHINKTLHVESVSCSQVKGFNSVYDCTVNAIIEGNPRTSQYRFTQQDDGSFKAQEQD